MNKKSETEHRVLTAALLRSIARTLFVTAYADRQDELRAQGRRFRHPGPGGEWFTFAPATSPDAKKAALDLAKRWTQRTEVTLAGLYRSDLALNGLRDTVAMRDRWAHRHTMRALGHGVAWSDDYEDAHVGGRRIPHVEFSL